MIYPLNFLVDFVLRHRLLKQLYEHKQEDSCDDLADYESCDILALSAEDYKTHPDNYAVNRFHLLTVKLIELLLQDLRLRQLIGSRLPKILYSTSFHSRIA